MCQNVTQLFYTLYLVENGDGECVLGCREWDVERGAEGARGLSVGGTGGRKTAPLLLLLSSNQPYTECVRSLLLRLKPLSGWPESARSL